MLMESRRDAVCFTLSASPWDEPITNATSPAPLPARSSRYAANSSLVFCFPSTHSAARLLPLGTAVRMARASFSSALPMTAGEAFFSAMGSSGSSTMFSLQ